jgi:hypothetical protein
MKLLKKILQKFNGLHYKQEYLCVGKESLTQPLHAYLTNNSKVIKDITKLHSFVGYNPLIFAFVPGSIPGDEEIEIVFSPEIYQPGEQVIGKQFIAKLEMRKISESITAEGKVLFYEGVKGIHRFIKRIHQFIVQLNNHLYSRKPGNVYLEDNLYKQVQIAYSIPRIISLISLSSNNLFNLFPTDLHGEISENYYIISLRHEGKACRQVETIQKLVISKIDALAFKEVYVLGKNHMQELKSKEQFRFCNADSEQLQVPLPYHVIEYRELEFISSFKHGIHKILLFRILSKTKTGSEANTLSHIHSSYATWRLKQGLKGNFLMR